MEYVSGNKYKEINIDEFIERYNSGMSIASICSQMNISKGKAQRTRDKLIAQGKIEPRKDYVRFQPNPKFDIDEQKLIERFENGDSQLSIAKEFGVNEKTIRTRVKQYYENNNLMDKYDDIICNHRKASTDKMRAQVNEEEFINKVNEGCSNREIGRHFGISHSTVADIKRRLGVG